MDRLLTKLQTETMESCAAMMKDLVIGLLASVTSLIFLSCLVSFEYLAMLGHSSNKTVCQTNRLSPN